MSGESSFKDDLSSPRSSLGDLDKEDLDPLLADSEPVQRPVWLPRSNRRKAVIAIVIGCIAFALAIGLSVGLMPKRGYFAPKRNVIVIMTDDQDMLLDSMSAMPNVTRLIGGQGVTYQNHYCTVAWCCPSRVNFFTGKAAHNTNVTSIHVPYGGWPKFAAEGLNENYLPIWLHEAGIRTYYLAKFLNGYSVDNVAIPAHPKGWDNSSMLVDPYTNNYTCSHWTNGYTNEVNSYNGTHTTEVTQAKALEYLDDAGRRGEQFFMMVAPVAPHTEKGFPPPIPERYKGVFDDRKAPRGENFNPDEPSGVSWVSKLKKLTEGDIRWGDKMQQHRLANVAAVDDMVANMVQKLDDLGILDNTYIIYTSDNGFHIGNHRLRPGKRLPFEEDINIPLLIRGPDVAKGVVTNHTSSHTNMAPTILQMLGLEPREDFDGGPLPYTASALGLPNKNEMVNVEFWTSDIWPVGLHWGEYYNNTYKALRLASANYSLYYSVWCTGEREFYDMKADASQMNNRLGPLAKGIATSYFGRSEEELIHRLDALLMVTKGCKGESCRDPWSVMFPKGEVSDLQQAMHERYDSYFFSQPKISFTSCDLGYMPEVEGPQEVVPFTWFS